VKENENGAQVEQLEKDALHTPSDLSSDGVEKITNELRQLPADVFALYVRTKNSHWHMSGRHFRDYHLLLDEQSQQIFAMTDDIAERARKIGGTTIHSISDMSRNQRLHDNNDDFVTPEDMLADLSADNQRLTRLLRAAHEVCDRYNNVRHCQFDRNLDRRDGTPHLVFMGNNSGCLIRLAA
jgi:starvation-inducible DNA-binding protein